MYKIKNGIIITMAILTLFGCGNNNYLPLETVDSVDVNRYLGKWYEAARLPNKFQDNCFCATAEYTLIDSVTIGVRNECFEESTTGEKDFVDGKAFIVENSMNSKLKVQFFWPFKGDYWIIDLDKENYSYAVVGTPSRKYLWILSRTPKMDEVLLKELLEKAKKNNFDISKIHFTEKNCYE